jgi:hypothetical protein
LAVLILRGGDGGTHTGILHRMGDRLFLLDLCWHLTLRSVPHHYEFACVVPAFLPEEVNDITALCRLIGAKHQAGMQIPYALALHPATHFDETGGLVLGEGLGLTCSTFVLKVFASAGVQLVDTDSWIARPDDDARHAELLRRMRDGWNGFPKADAAHVKKVEETLPCIRVRPEEVAGAALHAQYPVGFENAKTAGEWLLGELTAA